MKLITKGYGDYQKITMKGLGGVFIAFVTEIVDGLSTIWNTVSAVSRLWK